MRKETKLTDIPESMLQLIEPANRGGKTIYALRDGHNIGQVKTAHVFDGMYRIYLESDDRFGEYRYTIEQAEKIYLII